MEISLPDKPASTEAVTAVLTLEVTNLLSVMPTPSSIIDYDQNIVLVVYSNWEALSFFEAAVIFSSNIHIFVMESPHFSAIRSTWKHEAHGSTYPTQRDFRITTSTVIYYHLVINM